MSEKLRALLKNQICDNGPMDIGLFMAQVLGHPEHGYYMRQDPFGAAGDFTTAPEISQMFGELIGAWIADVWIQMGAPNSFVLLECGPGRGTLMADALRAAKKVDGFHEALEVHFLETSPTLKRVQAEAVQTHNPVWHDSLETLPADKPLIVIGNEFLDALPMRQLQKTKEGWAERVIGLDGDDFCFGLKPYGGGVPEDVSGAREGHIFEFSPAQLSFVEDVAQRLKTQSGAALFIDYGETKTQAGESLQAIYKHDIVSVLEHVGDADISANVDFGAMGDAARGQGATVHGPVEQGEFLKQLGIEARAAGIMKNANETQQQEIEKSLRRLTESDQMGSLFKVIGFSDGAALTPAGF